jgi:prolyl oligopeptidase
MNALGQLGKEYWEWVLETHPTYATFLGDHRYDDRWEDLDAVARTRDLKALRGFLDRLDAISLKGLSREDRISAGILRLTLESGIEAFRHQFHQWNIDQMSGPQVSLPELLNWHPTTTEQGLNDLLTRYRTWPRYMAQYLENLREGVIEDRLAPRVAVERVKGQLASLLAADPAASPLIPLKVPPAWKARIIDAVRQHVYPAFTSFARFLEAYPAREAIGMDAMPGGREAYAFLVRDYTTTDLTPKAIHAMGLRELASIHAEMREIAGVRDIKAFLQRFREDRTNTYRTRQEILKAYTVQLDQCWKALPDWFGTLPRQKCGIKPIESYREQDAPGAYYYDPPEDGSRPGIFYINTYKPVERQKSGTATLTVHEAVPGHHLQIALAQEQKGLPAFRRHGRFIAFIEGWALYAERLGDRMGLYRNDADRLGMLAGQAFRASRLVVDTGIHAFGWSREKAFRYHQENAGLSDVECANEIDRYIIMPAQALAYMIGRKEIEACRTRAEKTLGPRFDIRAFHDAVLLGGALPLTTLRKVIDEWAKERKSQRRR